MRIRRVVVKAYAGGNARRASYWVASRSGGSRAAA